MAESQIVIKVDRNILRMFRAECMRRETTPTQQIGKFIVQQTDEWCRGGPFERDASAQYSMTEGKENL